MPKLLVKFSTLALERGDPSPSHGLIEAGVSAAEERQPGIGSRSYGWGWPETFDKGVQRRGLRRGEKLPKAGFLGLTH